MPQQSLVTRFAPSPTGYLHLGHVASAIYVWGMARLHGARVLLRIEDHDRGRCRPEYEAAIFADLGWLGLAHDNHDLAPGHASAYRQSDAHEQYNAAIEALAKHHLIYACTCTRQEILNRGDRTSGHDAEELRYDGHCRERGLSLQAPGSGLRIAVPPQTLAFSDQRLGKQAQTPAQQCGDLLLRDRHGQYTYNFAVVVDDLRQGVNWIVRGEDVLHATGRQIWLAEALGRPQPASFFHHPLIKGGDGQKLSKRFLASSIASRRAAGDSPAMILGEAAFQVGLIAQPRALSAGELPHLFETPASDGKTI